MSPSLIYILIQTTNYFAKFIYLVILIRCILSWIPSARNSTVSEFIYLVTEPLLAPARNMLNKSPIGGGTGIDFSPVLVVIVLDFLNRLIVSFLYQLY